ncbi:hypothetical protein NXW95_11685 [Phocaeicola vulgatus]|jgi:hypothetical protein|nr:hypothetical protein [Parabacteroides merdae]MCS3013548.1 hypothetical protein [Phocaeicola vulgatus]UVY10111.1 MAG: Terminase [Bacteriophage sp.]UWF99765.1 MAG: Terminase [Bacteriophage sp.]UWG06891.1 MAG: Terminase [Bacteriophage sp.]
MSQNDISNDEFSMEMERIYMNSMQVMVNLIDPNKVVVEAARASGKTSEVTVNRIVRVADSMPAELSFLAHRTYVALLTNIWPNIQAAFSRQITVNGRPRCMLEYGIDYIAGESKIPEHFRKPRYPISYPKHSILFRNGHHIQLVSSDQPDSVAGRSGVHAFVEEMKHNDGEKLKTRLFPSLRGSSAEIRKSPYYQGWTGVSDTARVDLNEDDWFERYEDQNNPQLLSEIATVAVHVNKAVYKRMELLTAQKNTTNPVTLEKIRLELKKYDRQISMWTPRLADMRRNATLYIRASSFVNKDILGPKFFKTQLDTLDMDEFLTAICAVRHKSVVNKFFANYDKEKHQFSDGYIYDSIMKLDLKDHFIITARYLKYYDKSAPLYIGYDPGHFSSLVCGQPKKYGKEFRLLKEFFCFYPDEQPELARQVYEFFGRDCRNKRIVLYPDRAGNKRREELEQITTDSRALKRELESYGFEVQLMNEGQATIYHWQQFKLMLLLFGDRSNALPHVFIDENECPNLCSAIPLSPRKSTNGRIELDKSSEVKIPLHRQAGLTTQIPSAFIYLMYGLYGDAVLNELTSIPDDIPDNFSL